MGEQYVVVRGGRRWGRCGRSDGPVQRGEAGLGGVAVGCGHGRADRRGGGHRRIAVRHPGLAQPASGPDR